MADRDSRMEISTYELIPLLERYIATNEKSSDVETRWFAAQLRVQLDYARRIRSTGHTPEMKAAIRAFRLQEINAETLMARTQINILESEAKRLQSPEKVEVDDRDDDE